jgi:ABC-2 type transport system permease protein
MSLFLLQLKGELRKLFARKRTYIGFGIFFALEIALLVMFQLPKIQRSFQRTLESAGYGFDEYFSGVTIAYQVVVWTTFLLGALYVALVAGDIVSKEVEDGTMRMTLCRPISRVRLLLIKYCACLVYTFALIFFIGLSALGVGIAWLGIGKFFAVQPLAGLFAIYDVSEGHLRYLLCLPFLALSMTCVTSLGFALSCFNMKPAAATICTLSYFIADLIFIRIPYFEEIKTWFITSHTESWYNLLRFRIPWPTVIDDYSYLLGVNATLVIIAIVVFQRRDFKS